MDWKKLLNKTRPRKSTSEGDHRQEFERDYDRSVFSNPVKRLQDKAQVFPLDPNDAVRTRLTHSLEVSTVARGFATNICAWLRTENEIEAGMERHIEAICATCGLIHDLGNPPFGHAGETAIQSWFQRRNQEGLVKFDGLNEQQKNDFLKFEGNAQSLRLVSKLQILADFNGLNLTFGTLSASCKYISSSADVDERHAYSKPGYFYSENELVRKIREETGTGNARNPITYIVEAADDIVYSVADLEDAVKKKVVEWESFQAELKKDDLARLGCNVLESKDHILRAGKQSVPEGLPGDVHASAFRTAAIKYFVDEAVTCFKTNYRSIMDGTFDGELVKLNGQPNHLMGKLKDWGHKKIYCTPQNLKLEIMGRRIIWDLMDIFWEGASSIPKEGIPKTKNFEGKIGTLLSENYCKVFRNSVAEEKLPELYCRYQLMTDYICGMTDTFARRLHQELTNV